MPFLRGGLFRYDVFLSWLFPAQGIAQPIPFSHTLCHVEGSNAFLRQEFDGIPASISTAAVNDDGPALEMHDLLNSLAQLLQGNEHRTGNVVERPHEFLGYPHIDEGYVLGGIEFCLHLLRGDILDGRCIDCLSRRECR